MQITQPSSVGRGLMQKFSSERGKSLLTLAKERAEFQHMFFAVPKSSPYIKEINREYISNYSPQTIERMSKFDLHFRAMWYYSSGIFNYWYVVREKYPKECMLTYNSKGQSLRKLSHRRLKLEQFYLPFLILFGGYFLAFMQFIREKLYCPLARWNPSLLSYNFEITI